jgi:hypothetical protein
VFYLDKIFQMINIKLNENNHDKRKPQIKPNNEKKLKNDTKKQLEKIEKEVKKAFKDNKRLKDYFKDKEHRNSINNEESLNLRSKKSKKKIK